MMEQMTTLIDMKVKNSYLGKWDLQTKYTINERLRRVSTMVRGKTSLLESSGQF